MPTDLPTQPPTGTGAKASAVVKMDETFGTEMAGVGERVYGDACYDYEEFFERTRYVIPKKVLWNGRVTAYDNEMGVRFLDRVIVKDDGYEVWFKDGIMVERRNRPQG